MSTEGYFEYVNTTDFAWDWNTRANVPQVIWARCTNREKYDPRARAAFGENCQPSNEPIPCDEECHERTFGAFTLLDGRPSNKVGTKDGKPKYGQGGGPCLPLYTTNIDDVTVRRHRLDVVRRDSDLSYRMTRWAGESESPENQFTDRDVEPRHVRPAEEAYSKDKGAGSEPVTCDDPTCSLERCGGEGEAQGWDISAPKGPPRRRSTGIGWAQHFEIYVCIKAKFKCVRKGGAPPGRMVILPPIPPGLTDEEFKEWIERVYENLVVLPPPPWAEQPSRPSGAGGGCGCSTSGGCDCKGPRSGASMLNGHTATAHAAADVHSAPPSWPEPENRAPSGGASSEVIAEIGHKTVWALLGTESAGMSAFEAIARVYHEITRLGPREKLAVDVHAVGVTAR